MRDNFAIAAWQPGGGRPNRGAPRHRPLAGPAAADPGPAPPACHAGFGRRSPRWGR